MLLRFRKRFIPIIIIIMMIFSACSSNSEEGSEQADPGPAEEIIQDQDINTDEAIPKRQNLNLFKVLRLLKDLNAP